jgi:hypothetical protein|tara:strand:+ start:4496 stop:5215 length:720 start_codon:yes stop_codon:yes gene_type:complete
MAINLINIGNIANDGTGDDLREAFVKVNNNFEELDLRDNEKTTVSNIGEGIGLFDQIVNHDIQLKSILAGRNIAVTTDTAGNVIIDSDTNSITEITIQTESGEISAVQGQKLTLHGANGLDTYVENNVAYITYTGPIGLISETDPTLSVNLDSNNKDIINVNTLRVNNVVGNLTGNVTGLINGMDPATIAPLFDNYFDFGDVGRTVTSIIEFMLDDVDVDMGTIIVPETRNIDLGSIVV